MKEADFNDEYLKTIDKLPNKHQISLKQELEKPDLAPSKKKFYLKTFLIFRKSY
jgi:hypothetical protein